MTDEAILQKALEITGKNGFKGDFGESWMGMACNNHCIESEGPCVFSTIFSHDFNKAFWGENWMPRLQTMVLENDPIKYLEKYL